MATRALRATEGEQASVGPLRIAAEIYPPVALLRTLPQIPSFGEGLVSRPRLIRELDAARDRPLVLVTAPAGYGKTSLLAEWARSDARPFVWISAEEIHARPATAATSIARAFSAEERAGSADRGLVLVLDDAHTVEPRLLRGVTEAVLAQIPAGSQLAMASRARPGLALGRLRAARVLVELAAPDLAMTSREAAALLRRCGCALEARSLQALMERTEGWPAALYLAGLFLRRQPARDRDPAGFRGDVHVMAEYLRDTALADAPAEDIEFLTRTAPLTPLTGSLCDAVLRRSGSASTLEGLARRNLLVSPVDASHETFRVHPLLRDLLRSELRVHEPDLVSKVHRRASTWYARRREIDPATEHAVAARDVGRTGDLIWSNMLHLQASGRNDDVQRWLGRFSADEIAGYLPLAQAATHSALALGDMPLARLWARATVSARPGRMSRGAQERAVALAVVEAAEARSGEARMGDDAMRACRFEPEDSPWLPICLLLRGVSRHLAGQPQEASTHLTDAFDSTSVTAPGIAALCAAQLAIIAMDDEDWELALDLGDRAAVLVEEHQLTGCPTSALTYAVAAATRAHAGRVDEARADLLRCSNLMTGLGDFVPWYEVETRIMLARAALSLTDTVRARTLLAEASRFARRTRDAAIFRAWFDAAWDHIDAHAETALNGPSSLTIAELRILRFLPTHLSFREIADRLHVSANTVKSQAHAVYRKLDASSRSEAVANASAAGLLGQ